MKTKSNEFPKKNKAMSKKNDLLIAIGAILFAVLFYKQTTGLNYLIFSVIYALLNLFFNKENLNKTWYLAYGVHFLCAFNIFNVNTNLAVWAWVISLIFVIGKTFETKNSFILSSFFSLASTVSAFEVMFKKYFVLKKEEKNKPKLLYLGAILISFVLVLIFFFLYKGANPLFDDLTKKIDLSWFDIPFIFFTLLGFWICFIFVYPYVNQNNSLWDKNKLAELKIEDEDQNTSSKQFVGLIAILVFICLNIMLLSLNILDIKSIFILEKLPDNIFLSDFLHFSVWSIVFSVILAIILIVGIQQFKIKNNLIKVLIYIWIFQSLIMVFNTFVRNYWYSFNQITYLRIGVFVFLSMCIFGLIYTAYSIFKRRNYWFLLNLNLNTWFYVLVFTSLFSWDRIITTHNLKFEKIDQIDMQYLSSLSENNVDLLAEFYVKHSDLFEQYGYKRSTLTQDLLWKKHLFLWKMEHKSWQSYNLTDKMKYKKLKLN